MRAIKVLVTNGKHKGKLGYLYRYFQELLKDSKIVSEEMWEVHFLGSFPICVSRTALISPSDLELINTNYKVPTLDMNIFEEKHVCQGS